MQKLFQGILLVIIGSLVTAFMYTIWTMGEWLGVLMVLSFVLIFWAAIKS